MLFWLVGKYKMIKNKIKLIEIILISGLFLILSTRSVLAYQYGDDEDYNTRFKITKEVRIEGDTSWKDKVTDVKEDEVVEFRITIKNNSDDEADEADNMKMEDFLPEEMYRVGGSGLTEYWNDFEPGGEEKFTIKAKVKSIEYDKDVDFDKCVVNKAELRWDGEFQGSDTATVCYGKVVPSELPKTGAFSTLGLAGLGLMITGFITKKSSKK